MKTVMIIHVIKNDWDRGWGCKGGRIWDFLMNIWGNEPEIMYDVLCRTELGFGFTQEPTDQDFKKGRERMGE